MLASGEKFVWEEEMNNASLLSSSVEKNSIQWHVGELWNSIQLKKHLIKNMQIFYHFSIPKIITILIIINNIKYKILKIKLKK